MDLEGAAEFFSAEEQAIKGLLASLSETESDLAEPIKKLIANVKDEVDKINAQIEKLKKKLKQSLGKSQAAVGNELESSIGKLVGVLYQGLVDNEAILQQEAVKGGVLQPGEPIDVLVDGKPDLESPLKWGGQLILNMGDIKGVFVELLEVLREIRDRIGGVPMEFKGEEPAEDFEEPEQITTQLPDAPDYSLLIEDDA